MFGGVEVIERRRLCDISLNFQLVAVGGTRP
jgi:hypothetical protein